MDFENFKIDNNLLTQNETKIIGNLQIMKSGKIR